VQLGIFYTAFPDIYGTIDEVIAEGDRVVIRWHGGGTNTGGQQRRSGDDAATRPRPGAGSVMDLLAQERTSRAGPQPALLLTSKLFPLAYGAVSVGTAQAAHWRIVSGSAGKR
jgi:hypothetical protein